MIRKTLKGHSILEYTLVIGAVMAVIILVLLGGTKTSNVKNKIHRTYTKAADAINVTDRDADTGIFANATATDIP